MHCILYLLVALCLIWEMYTTCDNFYKRLTTKCFYRTKNLPKAFNVSCSNYAWLFFGMHLCAVCTTAVSDCAICITNIPLLTVIHYLCYPAAQKPVSLCREIEFRQLSGKCTFHFTEMQYKWFRLSFKAPICLLGES